MKKNLLSLFVILYFIFNTFTSYSQQCVVCDQNATGVFASVIGVNSAAMGVGSVAIGSNSHTLSDAGNSIAIGTAVQTVGGLSYVFGCGHDDNHLLSNDIQQSLMIGFNSTKPTLFISASPANSSYNRTGLIGIGNVTDPQAKLHLRADEDEEAALFIEPNDWDNGNLAVLYLGNKHNNVSANVEDGLVYTTQKNHIFKGGDVFIEDIDKGIIMKSPDGKCWRGTLDNSGSLHFDQLDTCPGATVSIPENKASFQGTITVYPNPVDHLLTVKLDENDFLKNADLKVSVINQSGAEIMSKAFNGTAINFYTADLPAGSYFVKVTDGVHAITRQFIKK